MKHLLCEAWKNTILHNDYSSKQYPQMVSHIQKICLKEITYFILKESGEKHLKENGGYLHTNIFY